MNRDHQDWEHGPMHYESKHEAPKQEPNYSWLERTRWQRIKTWIKWLFVLAFLVYIALRLMKVVH